MTVHAWEIAGGSPFAEKVTEASLNFFLAAKQVRGPYPGCE